MTDAKAHIFVRGKLNEGPWQTDSDAERCAEEIVSGVRSLSLSEQREEIAHILRQGCNEDVVRLWTDQILAVLSPSPPKPKTVKVEPTNSSSMESM